MNYSVVSMFIKSSACLLVCAGLFISSSSPPFQSLLLFSAANIINGGAQGSMLVLYGFLMVIFWINYVIYVPC